MKFQATQCLPVTDSELSAPLNKDAAGSTQSQQQDLLLGGHTQSW